jgi:hypothetical protein
MMMKHHPGAVDRTDMTGDSVCRNPYGGPFQFLMNRMLSDGHSRRMFWNNKPAEVKRDEVRDF